MLNVAILSSESDFCMRITSICMNLNIKISFPDKTKYIKSELLDVIIIDLNDKNFSLEGLFILKPQEKITIFGVLNKSNRSIENRARDAGVDLVFSKSIFITNFQTIVEQVKNAR